MSLVLQAENAQKQIQIFLRPVNHGWFWMNMRPTRRGQLRYCSLSQNRNMNQQGLKNFAQSLKYIPLVAIFHRAQGTRMSFGPLVGNESDICGPTRSGNISMILTSHVYSAGVSSYSSAHPRPHRWSDRIDLPKIRHCWFFSCKLFVCFARRDRSYSCPAIQSNLAGSIHYLLEVSRWAG